MRFVIILLLALTGCTDPVHLVENLEHEIRDVRQRLKEAETARLAIRHEKKRRDALKFEIRQLEAQLARQRKR